GLAAPRPRVVALERADAEPAPDDRAGQAQVLEVRRVVAGDPGRQYLRLPGSRRELQPLELTDHLEEPRPPVELRPGLEVLPAEEEAHEIGGRDGLDLAPEARERQPMDASEEAALAPFLGRRAGREAPAQRHTRPLERGEADGDRSRRQAGARGEGVDGDRARTLEPAAGDRPARILLGGLLAARGRDQGGLWLELRRGDEAPDEPHALGRHQRSP